MNRMQHEIRIARPPAEVFAYATTPALWPEWHPASLRLQPGAEKPLGVGATFEEDIRTAGREGHLSWVVEECEAGARWAARARADNGAGIFIRYRFEPEASGTRFVRELEYTLPNLLLRLANTLVLRRRIDAESRLSLQQLKERLERTAA
jgi:uncharacterized protein YndB with AHSA1/START domain